MDVFLVQIPTLRRMLQDAKDIVREHKILGAGPNGEVEQLKLRGVHCAGKKLREFLVNPTKPEHKRIWEIFALDCDQVSRLNHPNVAAFYGLSIIENIQDSTKHLTVIREYAKDDLTNLLEARPCLPWAVKTTVLLDVTKALDYLHTNKPTIVHHNLTSTNVLITDSMHAKVADMECACLYGTGCKLKIKLSYMSPETTKPNPKFETASDMFSFGNVALHVAVHMLPKDLSKGSTEIEKRQKYITLLKDPQGVDKALYDLILNCLQDLPEKRPTASMAMKELEKLVCIEDKHHKVPVKRITMFEMAETNLITPEKSKQEEWRSRQLQIKQIKEGVPSVLFLKETVKEGWNRRMMLKWMEYKFEISAKRCLQYSKLNGQVLKQTSLDDVTYVSAYCRAGDVYPFCVQFRSNQCWNLGAHSEEECKAWMEAIFPGSTQNQYFAESDSTSLHEPLKRSSTSPTFRTPSPTHDPAYIKYSEINVPSEKLKPPPVPERPVDTCTVKPDNTYLQVLPSSPDVDERFEAIDRFTLEQVHQMIEMFEKTGDAPQVSPQTRRHSTSIVTATLRPTKGADVRYSPVRVSQHSSKHPSKGLYVCFNDLPTAKEEVLPDDVFSSETPAKDSSPLKPHEETRPKAALSPRKALCRQNAVRNSKSSQKMEEIREKSSAPVKGAQLKLRNILRQQSSDEMLDRIDNPEWVRADLGDAEGAGHELSASDLLAASTPINSLSIATKDIYELTNIAIGHYGPVFRAKLSDSSHSEPISVTVKTYHNHNQSEDCVEFIQDIALLSASRHDNIVKYFGIVPENKWLVMEYSPIGDLKSYLSTKHQQNIRVSSLHLIKYMLDIAMGMHFIAEQRLVHRNLALRNILIMEDDTCKVADLGMRNRSFSVPSFGMAVSPHTDQRRWMSPENLTRGLFAEASDVWSFGVLQWEMYQPSRFPYSALSSSQFPQHIISGHTLDIPDVCSGIVAKIMEACWRWNTTRRPSFMYIASQLMKRSLGEDD